MIMLRLLRHHKDENLLNDLIDTIAENPGSCDQVWLSSEYGFPPLSVHEESANLMIPAAKKLRENGISVSLQISNTIGHGEYMKCKDCTGLVYEGSNVQNMIGYDGTPSQYCFCYNDEIFRRYVYDEIKMYSRFLPDCIWIDDDLRPTNHDPVDFGCFCDKCISRFNKRYASDFTRESLVYEINYGDIKWRENYIEFLRCNLSDFAGMLTDAAMSVSPDSYMGYQYAICSYYAGNDAKYIFDAFKKHSGKNPKSRPGGGFYSDHNPMEMLDKAMFLSYLNSKNPDYVTDICPEVENLPDVPFGKSNYGTCVESSLYLASGHNFLSYATLMNEYEPMSWHGTMLKMFSRHKSYWQQLISSNKNSKNGGLFIVTSDKSYQRKLNENDKAFAWADLNWNLGTQLLRIGLPLCYNKNYSSANLLHPDIIDFLSDEEIKELISKPVVTDTLALDKIIKRGFGEYFNLELDDLNIQFYKEQFNNHKINKGFENKIWKQGVLTGNVMTKRFIGESENLVPFSNFISSATEEYIGTANALVKTTVGGTWAVFAYSLWNNIVSFDKRNQILAAADYISELPAILKSPYAVSVYPSVNSNHETVSVSLLNCSISDTEELTLTIRNPRAGAFSIMSPGTEKQNVDFVKVGNEYTFKLPPIRGWQMITIL